MILVLEEDLTERIEFREKSDYILMVFKLNFLEKKGNRLGKCFKKFRVNCRIKRKSEGNV